MIIRNFFVGTSVSAETDGKKLADSIPYGGSFVATGLPLHRIQVELKTKLPDGRPAGSGAEIDFKAGTGTKATILIIPDPYGRFRPRFNDGRHHVVSCTKNRQSSRRRGHQAAGQQAAGSAGGGVQQAAGQDQARGQS